MELFFDNWTLISIGTEEVPVLESEDEDVKAMEEVM